VLWVSTPFNFSHLKTRRDSHDLAQDTVETYCFLRRSQVRVHGCCIEISTHFAAVARCEEQMACDVNVNFTRPQKGGLTDLIMGWLRLVGSLKSQVSFAEYRLFFKGSFAKETYNFKEPTNRSHPIRRKLFVCGWQFIWFANLNHVKWARNMDWAPLYCLWRSLQRSKVQQFSQCQ